MAQNGSDNDSIWRPKTDKEWHSRLYANNMNQATDLSSGDGKQPSTFELSDPDTVGIFIQPPNLRHLDLGHVGFMIAEDGGGTYYEIATDKEGAKRIHQKQLEREKEAYDLKGDRYLKGEYTLNRKEFSKGEWAKYHAHGSSCVLYTVTIIQAGFPVGSRPYKALEIAKKLKTPEALEGFLARHGESEGIIRKRVTYPTP